MLRGVGHAGRVGQGRFAPPAVTGTADFTLSNSSVTTDWALVAVGNLTATGAPAGSFFVLVEGTGEAGDDAGFAVVNG